METAKECLSSKYFSSFGYIVALSYLPALITFAGYTGSLRTSERRTFRCPSSPDSRDDCLVKYDEQYNSPFPLYGFVFVCFVPLLVVCIAYSWCFVKSRVDELETALKPDPENPRRRPRVTTRRVFCFYFLHLLVRFVLGILFTVLQNLVFYPSGFPSKFDCVSSTVKPAVNSTDFNATKDDGSAFNCDNSVGSDNAICAKGIWIVNILFAFLVFGEMCYLLARARKSVEFTYDSEFCQKYFFNKSGTPLRETPLRMKRQILEDTELLEPLIADEPESNRALDDIFVDLVIYTGRAQHLFGDLSERHEIFDIYLKPQHESIAIKELGELFLPNKDTKDPRKILIVGRPGMGKSLLGSIDNEMFQDILNNPEKVLLVFDGLDEFKHHESCLEDERAQGGNSATEEMPFSALYVKLVKGKQLSGATVLTTCRPNVVQSVASLEPKFDRKVEIMGFTPEKVKEYVEKFCKYDTKTVNRIWGHISNNLELLSLCYIPVNSFIVCSLLEELIKLHEEETASTLPATSTEVYEGALRLFLFKHHPEFKGKPLTKDYLMGNVGFSGPIEETLCQVGSLAKTGIEERRLVFDSTEVKGMENCGLFNRMPDSKVSLLGWRANFCFIHLTLQELLAAREIAKMDPSELSDFITSNASDPKWHLVIQFVAGLLRCKENEAVNSFVGLLHDSLARSPLELNNRIHIQKAILMMKCLHEYNNETTVEKAASKLKKNSKFNNRIDFSSCQITPVDCTAVLYFIKHLHELTELNLGNNNITDQGVSHLCDTLKYVNYCKLTKLNLSSNNITDQGVSHLCCALKDVNCKLTELDLGGNNITEQGVSHLCGALKDVNCKLTKLDLSSNNITDQGVSHLCGALKDVNCKLTKLDLSINNITDQGVSHLCGALIDVNCKLTKLDLIISSNNITDQGVSHLCDALKDVNCKLTKLDLTNNHITDQGVSHLGLCGALKDVNCKLTKLDLTDNLITDQGVSHLCGALKDVNCKLTKLDLGYNITDQGVSHLCGALKDVNCKLTKLDLRSNNITYQGVSHLCGALKYVNCKLTELNLSSYNITDQAVSHLCDALKDVNCKLTKLDLANNHITDQGVSHLCGALKDVNCKLTKLDLTNNHITDQGVSHLCGALKDVNCKLTKLDLRGNNITDQGVSHLCDALKDVNCKLTKLNLTSNNITDQGVSHLCDALKDVNCKLTKLDLTNNHITDQGVSHLCDALKDVNCKLTKLYLHYNRPRCITSV
ncbi:hypothetical protein OS493_006262 [Desmophyllum pertusum]|uniref:NACHT domain-containing protein n=1 Tax=Desmophyllum pertusum TaxID=174260 RepID=A0A9X0A563_9CNID|nr:hypothetical protein OS493_006262 [Desmophyllum pertusum]